MSDISDGLMRKKCAPCEGGIAPMTDAQIGPMLKGLTGWQRDKYLDFNLSDSCARISCADSLQPKIQRP